MHDEAWGPRDPRDRRGGGHRMRVRMRGGMPWGGPEGPGGPFEFGMRGGPFGPPKFGGRGPRGSAGGVPAAILDQVAQAGSAAQVQQADKILADTRRALYRILAADGEETEQDTQG